MGVIDAPQWLLPAFVRSVRAVGASAPVEQIQASGESLIEAWSTPDRHFHNLRHVIDLLARVDELAEETHNPDVMRLAAWYHGAVFSSCREESYRRNGGEDEVASAVLAAKDLNALGVPDVTVDRVSQLILNLKRHNLPPKDIDAMALSDADLGTLAVEPQQYKKYRAQVFAEYAHLPAEDYLSARTAIVTKLLSRDRLFSSPMGVRWESAARENLTAELRILKVKADELAKGATLEEAMAVAAQAAHAEPTGDARQGGESGGRPAVTQGQESTASAPQSASARPTGDDQPPAAGRQTGDAGRTGSGQPDQAERAERASERRPAVPVPSTEQTPTSPAEAGGSRRAPATGEVPAVPSPDGADESGRRSQSRTVAAEGISAHATSMESCAEDLDRLMSSRRGPAPDAGGQTSEGPATSRQAQVEAERARMQERLRRKVEEAKSLREARTGEFAPITEEIVDDSANLS